MTEEVVDKTKESRYRKRERQERSRAGKQTQAKKSVENEVAEKMKGDLKRKSRVEIPDRKGKMTEHFT